jgi:hypothetical protein
MVSLVTIPPFAIPISFREPNWGVINSAAGEALRAFCVTRLKARLMAFSRHELTTIEQPRRVGATAKTLEAVAV